MEYCENGNLKACLNPKTLLHDQQEAVCNTNVKRLEMYMRNHSSLMFNVSLDPMFLKKICVDVS